MEYDEPRSALLVQKLFVFARECIFTREHVKISSLETEPPMSVPSLLGSA